MSLKQKNIEFIANVSIDSNKIKLPKSSQASYSTKQGDLIIKSEFNAQGTKITKATLNGTLAPNGKYKLGFMWYAHIENGIVKKVTML